MEVDDDIVDVCVICNQKLCIVGDSVKLSEKGANSINEASRFRKSNVFATSGESVHMLCRKTFTDKKNIGILKRKGRCEEVKRKSVRLIDGPVSNTTHCLFCGKFVDFSSKHKPKTESVKVRTTQFVEAIKKCCELRCDEWSFNVRGRLAYCSEDLVSAGCVYHQSCSANFRSWRNIPKEYCTNKKPSEKGRPANEEQYQAFLRTCEFFEENDEEQMVIGDLISKMEEYLQGGQSRAYDRKYMKIKLLEYYGENIIISGSVGKSDIVTLRDTANGILRSYHKNASHSSDIELQKIQLIEAAAKIIKSDVKSLTSTSVDEYPSPNELTVENALNFIPNTLKLLLSKLFVGKDTSVKIGSVGQSIMQSIRPRALLCPLQIGLSVQLHHNYRSRCLIDSLHNLGFCSSYAEVSRFEKNAAVSGSCVSFNVAEDTTLLLAADNVDHNICTLDGKNTFHGMGMIAAITPKITTYPTVKRDNVGDIVIKNLGKVDLLEYKHAKTILGNILFCKLPILPNAPLNKLSLLWQISTSQKPGPSWSGTMQIMHSKSDVTHSGKSSISFLPIIDMAAGDMSCIFSTLTYLNKLAYNHGFPCVVTFDQPLFWKASQIINTQNELQEITLMLGTFHTLMNVLGAIGTLMNGSGLFEILEEIYGSNTVVHMMTGKAVSRAIRGHMIVDAALSTLIVSEVFPPNEDGTSQEFVQKACDILDGIMTGQKTIKDIEQSDVLSLIDTALETKKNHLQSSSRTSKLWLEYQRMVMTVRMLIEADRTNSWDLHLYAMREILPIVAAAGHVNYLKSLYLYLQNMFNLSSKNAKVHKLFQEGKFVIRRSDQFWGGLGSDLVIEQVLMRSLKSRGGLTRGSGLTENQRSTWLFSMPICSTYNLAMQEYADVIMQSSEQHKELRGSRQNRDSNDIKTVLNMLKPISPFQSDPTLRNIVTGVTAGVEVNVDEFHHFGTNIISKMVGNDVFRYSAKRSDKVTTLGSPASISGKESSGPVIDPTLLFQRMMTVATYNEMNLEDVMRHELCAYPATLFESKTMMRKADKSQLAQALVKHIKPLENEQSDTFEKTEMYVLDGGSLLHRISWSNNESYENIAMCYVNFVLKSYGKAVVVFDGYNGSPTTKDGTHRRRYTKASRDVNFSSGMKFSGKKEQFLANERNKQAMISLLGVMLETNGCTVYYAVGDADVDIARAAAKSAENMHTTVIGEDTDLLILLLYHGQNNGFKLYFRSDVRKGPNPNPVYDIFKMQSALGYDNCNFLLFLHAFTGCDTTSRIYSIGKSSAFDKLMKDTELQSVAEIFCSQSCSHSDIAVMGEKAMLLLYDCKSAESLDKQRYQLLVGKVTKAKTFVNPERLPPTISSTKYHSYRTYLQINMWKCTDDRLKPEDWGWYKENNVYHPILCDLPPAPDYLLNMIRCSCKKNCVSLRCGCKRNGLPCSTACGDCQMKGCQNCYRPSNYDSDESDEHD